MGRSILFGWSHFNELAYSFLNRTLIHFSEHDGKENAFQEGDSSNLEKLHKVYIESKLSLPKPSSMQSSLK